MVERKKRVRELGGAEGAAARFRSQTTNLDANLVPCNLSLALPPHTHHASLFAIMHTSTLEQ